MNFKLLFGLCVAIFALQGASYARPQDEIEKGLGDDLKKLLEKIMDIIKDALANAAAQLGELIDELKRKAEELVESIIDSIKGKIGEILTGIDELIAETEQMGVDVTECVKDQKEAIKNIPNKVIETGKECIKSNIDYAKNIVDETINIIKDYGSNIDNLGDAWDECKTVLCKIGVIAEATTITVDLPKEIKKKITEAIAFIKNIDDELVLCLNETLTSAVTQADRISNEIYTCIQNKIPQHQSDSI